MTLIHVKAGASGGPLARVRDIVSEWFFQTKHSGRALVSTRDEVRSLSLLIDTFAEENGFPPGYDSVSKRGELSSSRIFHSLITGNGALHKPGTTGIRNDDKGRIMDFWNRELHFRMEWVDVPRLRYRVFCWSDGCNRIDEKGTGDDIIAVSGERTLKK
jgi:hypothetical protein